MAATAGLTLAGLLALATHLQQGLDQFRQEHWAQAETELTAALEVQPAVAEMQTQARLYRGQARLKQDRKKEALEDAAGLLRSSATPPDVRRSAAALYRAAGGEPKALAPEVPPLKVVMGIVDNVKSDNADNVVAALTPELKEAFDRSILISPATGDNLPSFHDALITAFRGIEDFQLTELQADPLAGRAAVRAQGDTITFDVMLALHGAEWKCDGLANIVSNDGTVSGSEEADESAPAGPTGPDAEPVSEATPEQRKEIEARIAELGSAEFKVRADAARRLKELGPVARPFLKARQQDPDPEVAAAVRELLGGR